MRTIAALLGLAIALPAAAQDTPPPLQLEEVVVQAREPRYVAPTRRDRIGRVWVPTLINGRGPFRLVLDSGATRTAILPAVAARLGLRTDRSPPVILRGVTGSATVPTVKADSLEVGDLYIAPTTLPLINDAFGGAEGLLGTEGLGDKRIYIDFRKDFINIARSKGQPAESGFITLPMLRRPDKLISVSASVSGVPVLAILDTGAQATVGNAALRTALEKRLRDSEGTRDEIIGATGDAQSGEGQLVRRIQIGGVQVERAHLTFGDMAIFSHWKLRDEPILLVGMDVLGLLDTLVIDYRRREVMVRLVESSRPARQDSRQDFR